jgi:hypothetical protein
VLHLVLLEKSPNDERAGGGDGRFKAPHIKITDIDLGQSGIAGPSRLKMLFLNGSFLTPRLFVSKETKSLRESDRVFFGVA